MHQPGGSRNFGGGIVETDRLTPLYTAQELRRVFDRVHDPTATMADNDDHWADSHREQFDRTLAVRIARRTV